MTTENAVSQETPTEAPGQFLRAWKDAVQLAGSGCFACQANKPEFASHWHQLTPLLDVIRKKVVNRSRADAAFLAAVASFYNSEEGAKLLAKVNVRFGDLPQVLTQQQRGILASLFINFGGW